MNTSSTPPTSPTPSAAPRVSPFWRLWGWPLALALATTSGLLTALVSDGWGDAWSWFGLGLPVAVMGWYALVARSPAERPQA